MASEIDALITNHTAADHYDCRDYNRVGAAVAYVAGVLNGECGFNISVTAKQSWTASDIPTQSDINRYLADIQKCRAAFVQIATTPNAPDVMRYDVDTANRIEKILLDAEDSVRRLKLGQVYSGEVFSGEV